MSKASSFLTHHPGCILRRRPPSRANRGRPVCIMDKRLMFSHKNKHNSDLLGRTTWMWRCPRCSWTCGCWRRPWSPWTRSGSWWCSPRSSSPRWPRRTGPRSRPRTGPTGRWPGRLTVDGMSPSFLLRQIWTKPNETFAVSNLVELSYVSCPRRVVTRLLRDFCYRKCFWMKTGPFVPEVSRRVAPRWNYCKELLLLTEQEECGLHLPWRCSSSIGDPDFLMSLPYRCLPVHSIFQVKDHPLLSPPPLQLKSSSFWSSRISQDHS